MKPEKIRELTEEELKAKIDEETLGYDKMKLTHAITPLESPAKLKETKKLIARLKTELRSRALNAKENI